MKNPAVLLTVPHGFCKDKINRDCDRKASEASKSLQDKLFSAGFSVHRLEVNHLRSDGDENRRRSIHSPYRKLIREVASEHKENIVIVLDIHSYPDEEIDWGRYELVILDDAESPKNYTESLLSDLSIGHIPAKIIRGGDNSIEDDMRDNFRLDCVLLEFRESLTSERINYISDVIVTWIQKYYNVLTEKIE